MNPRSRLRLLLSGGNAPNVPINPALLAGLQLYLEASQYTLSTDVVANTQVDPSDGSSIQSFIQPGDSFGGTPAFMYAEQTVLEGRPLLDIDGQSHYQLIDNSGCSMPLSGGGFVLNGDFVVWLLMFRGSIANIFPVGGSTPKGGIGIDNSKYSLLDNSSGEFTQGGALGETGFHLVRFRRSGGVLFVLGTEMSGEEDLGSSPNDVTLDTLLATDVMGKTPDGTNNFLSVIISTDSGLAVNPPAGIDKAGGYFDVGQSGYGGYGIHL